MIVLWVQLICGKFLPFFFTSVVLTFDSHRDGILFHFSVFLAEIEYMGLSFSNWVVNYCG